MSVATLAVSVLGSVLPGTRSNRLLILIYHRVHAHADAMFPRELTAQRFDWQMELLRKHCAPLSLREGVSRLRAGSLPSRAVAVTFDDGYADNALVALPILKKHEVPATFFVSTGFLDGGCMWNDILIESLRRTSGVSVDLSALGLGVEALGSAAQKGELAGRALRAVKHLHPQERLRRVSELSQSLAVALPRDLMMTTLQVRELAAAGMEIGAHTVDHPILRSLSLEEAREEIAGGRAVLERIVGEPVTSFAYPNGRPGDDYTGRDRDLVESMGFEQAVSTTRGAAHEKSDFYQLPRFTPWDRSPHRWLGRLLLAFGEKR
jgi:peptidoglycan/xylan/chitin deacetylase (PgdA/CDA1 family)